MKTCTRCKQTKPIRDMSIDRRRPSGLHPWCRACKGSGWRRRGKRVYTPRPIDYDQYAIRCVLRGQRMNLNKEEKTITVRLVRARGGTAREAAELVGVTERTAQRMSSRYHKLAERAWRAYRHSTTAVAA